MHLRSPVLLPEPALYNVSTAEELSLLNDWERELFYMTLSQQESRELRWDWKFWGRPAQQEPPGDWGVWLAMAGRGFGKTRLGAEWACEQAKVCRHIALVAETAADARDVMVKGPSGICSVAHPDRMPAYQPSLRRLEWPNGAVAHTYSAEDPEQLRGPEHDTAWSDEAAKWKYPDETWDMLQFGLRVGNPRQLVTTTPRPIQLLRDIIADEGKPGGTVVTRGSTFENYSNLAPRFLAKMLDKYDGTRLGRQELRAELLDDVSGALWTRLMLSRRTERNPKGAGMSREEELRLPDMVRVVVGVDPSGTSGEQSLAIRRRADKEDEAGDDVGIVAVGLGDDGIVYVLEDATCNLGPAGWAAKVHKTYKRHRADQVVGESNFGGAMVEFTIRTVDRRIPYRNVIASRGKVVRAQPIAALYEQGRVRHVGALPKLEDQMVGMTQTGYEGRGSPDRVDALVWAITELVFGKSDRGFVTTVGGHH